MLVCTRLLPAPPQFFRASSYFKDCFVCFTYLKYTSIYPSPFTSLSYNHRLSSFYHILLLMEEEEERETALYTTCGKAFFANKMFWEQLISEAVSGSKNNFLNLSFMKHFRGEKSLPEYPIPRYYGGVFVASRSYFQIRKQLQEQACSESQILLSEIDYFRSQNMYNKITFIRANVSFQNGQFVKIKKILR